MSKEDYLKAGQIHKEVCKKAREWVKPGEKYIDIAKKIEALIQEKGTSLAFPVNLQRSNIVHYTPIPDDENVVEKDDLIKVDIGIHVNGFIADGAFTVTFDKKYDDMVKFTEQTLKKVLTDLKPGMKVSEIGRRLDEEMKDSKYKIIRNLSGHQLDQWKLHSTKQVNVYETESNATMNPGEAYAVEIFITDGDGWINSSNKFIIFSMKEQQKPVRNPKVKKMIKEIFAKRKSLPFSERYVIEHLGYSKIDFFLLKQSGNLREYSMLFEKPESKVAQFEDVIYVDKDEVIVTTK